MIGWRLLKGHLSTGTRAITSAKDVIHRLWEERHKVRRNAGYVGRNERTWIERKTQMAVMRLVFNTKPLPLSIHERPAEVGYTEGGCARGADLRLDWRRAFLSLDDAATPCHSVGRP